MFNWGCVCMCMCVCQWMRRAYSHHMSCSRKTKKLRVTIDFFRRKDPLRLYPIKLDIVHFAVCLPIFSVHYERRFSVIKTTKTKLGNRMYLEKMTHVISVSVNGPYGQHYNFETSFEIWSSIKRRRILQKYSF